jgi:hypothetical protein
MRSMGSSVVWPHSGQGTAIFVLARLVKAALLGRLIHFSLITGPIGLAQFAFEHLTARIAR